MGDNITVGVLALQGGFSEHLTLLRRASSLSPSSTNFTFVEVRNAENLARCQALVIPGGESTTMSLVAGRLGLLEPLREFVKTKGRPTWGTCAGLIMLAEEANATKKGGQELIGGLDVRVHRNHFGRQIESFETDLDLSFLDHGLLSSASVSSPSSSPAPLFPAVFIRAPVVEKILSRPDRPEVQVLAVLPGRSAGLAEMMPAECERGVRAEGETGDVVAVRQGNVFGTSFHPELTDDVRIHAWWLRQVEASYGAV